MRKLICALAIVLMITSSAFSQDTTPPDQPTGLTIENNPTTLPFRICWNSNDADLWGKGLEHNFNLVQDDFADTVHVREFNRGNYPYPLLIALFVKMNYKGWILLEARGQVPDRVAAMKEQGELFTQMVAAARTKA